MVEKTKKESAKEVYIAFKSVLITKRVKRVVQPQNRQKVRVRNETIPKRLNDKQKPVLHTSCNNLGF
jgi:hypothetical protein